MSQEQKINTEILQIISAEQAHNYRIVPIKNESSITFITDTFELTSLREELQIVLGKDVCLEKEDSKKINEHLQQHYRFVQHSKRKTSLNSIILMK